MSISHEETPAEGLARFDDVVHRALYDRTDLPSADLSGILMHFSNQQ